jgi:serine/threonine protein phosphatase PrpC
MLARLRGMAEAILQSDDRPEVEAAAVPVNGGSVELCPHCRVPRKGSQSYCDNCGWVFPAEPAPAPAAAAEPAAPERVAGRYELRETLWQRDGVSRYRGYDHAAPEGHSRDVLIVRGATLAAPEAVPVGEEVPAEEGPSEADTPVTNEILPSFEDLSMAATVPLSEMPRPRAPWPGPVWEAWILEHSNHPSLPAVLDAFSEGGFDYLVEEVPTGRPLWDAWDDPGSTNEERYGWLKHVAEALASIHRYGVILEGLRPDIVVVAESGMARLIDLVDLLPLPLPPNAPIRGTLYSAPELAITPETADARADLFSFGAMLYALHVGRELTEMDFEREGTPKLFIPRFPDVHPLVGRLISKTFCRDLEKRFPSDEAAREDATGFVELKRTLDVCRRTLDNVRFETAAWTTIGMVRTGNEDAFALLHAAQATQDELAESVLVLLADGMGGYEAGEVAAALAIDSLRKVLLARPPFSALGSPADEAEDREPLAPGVQGYKDAIRDALKAANRHVFQAARSGVGRRGMGCTAEVVYLQGRDLVVGHVGDSRCYHLRQGQLVQVTRDQTLVNRLVELGTLSAADAENHPRRSELQQAIGGHADVEPELYHATMVPGDWVVVCSDGLSNHVTAAELQQMLQSEATSAEMAARRLVNFANVKGATDNATVAVIRVT